MRTKITRRNFLKLSAFASSSLLIPNFLKAVETEKVKAASEGGKLIVVQLSGGNDGLNTVIPFKNDIYYKSRPKIAVMEKNVLKLNNELGLNPSMKGLMNLYDNGNLAVVNSVGYPNPDRSHFRSMDIWQSGSSSGEYRNTGWIGRYLDSECKGCDLPYHAIEVDEMMSLALKGEKRSGIAVQNPASLFASSTENFINESARHHKIHDPDENVDYLYKTLIEATSSADYIYSKSKIFNSKGDYANSLFGKNMKTIAELIISGIDTQVFYISLPGFDTHNNQVGRQERLLRELSGTLNTFMKDMKTNGRDGEVLVMVFSEFGRRVSQNASGGTDHGTANNIFLAGGNLSGAGIYNDIPDLNDLENGDLKYKIDFRSVYSTILNKWLKADDTKVLGNDFPYLDFI